MNDSIVFPITDEKEIALIQAVRDGSKPITELRNIIGRRSVDQAMTNLQRISFQVRIYLQNYVRDPIGTDLEFLKSQFASHNGRNKKVYTINGHFEVEETSSNVVFLKVKLNKILEDMKNEKRCVIESLMPPI